MRSRYADDPTNWWFWRMLQDNQRSVLSVSSLSLFQNGSNVLVLCFLIRPYECNPESRCLALLTPEDGRVLQFGALVSEEIGARTLLCCGFFTESGPGGRLDGSRDSVAGYIRSRGQDMIELGPSYGEQRERTGYEEEEKKRRKRCVFTYIRSRKSLRSYSLTQANLIFFSAEKD